MTARIAFEGADGGQSVEWRASRLERLFALLWVALVIVVGCVGESFLKERGVVRR
jgi:hypothetical protein